MIAWWHRVVKGHRQRVGYLFEYYPCELAVICSCGKDWLV